MKKVIPIMFAIAIAIIATHTVDMHAVSQQQRRQQRQYYLKKKQLAQRRSAQQKKSMPLQRRGRAVQKKDPVIQKQQAQIDEKIKEKTKILEQATAQKDKATTPAQKAIAQKKVTELANDLLASISDERSFQQDILTGYEQKQIEQARVAITQLNDMRKKIQTKIQRKEKDLLEVTNIGFIWNEAIKGKEAEYNNLTAEIKKLKDTLAKIDTSLRNQKIIAGQEWSNAYRALVGAGALGATAAATNVALFGGAGVVGKTAIATKSGIATGLGSAASWAKEKGGSTWDWTKWSAQFGFQTATTLYGLYQAYTYYYNMYKTAEIVYNKAFGEYKAKNPNATPAQINAAISKEKADLDKTLQAYKDAEDKFKAELAQAEAQKAK